MSSYLTCVLALRRLRARLGLKPHVWCNSSIPIFRYGAEFTTFGRLKIVIYFFDDLFIDLFIYSFILFFYLFFYFFIYAPGNVESCFKNPLIAATPISWLVVVLLIYLTRLCCSKYTDFVVQNRWLGVKTHPTPLEIVVSHANDLMSDWWICSWCVV